MFCYLNCFYEVKNNLCPLERPFKENKNQAFSFLFFFCSEYRPENKIVAMIL